MLNKCFFIGKVSCEPRVVEYKYRTAVYFDILIEERWRDNFDQWQTRVDFFKCCVMSEGLLQPAKSLTKGNILHVEGKIRQFTTEDQNKIKHQKVIIDVIHIRLLGDLNSLKANPTTTYLNEDK